VYSLVATVLLGGRKVGLLSHALTRTLVLFTRALVLYIRVNVLFKRTFVLFTRASVPLTRDLCNFSHVSQVFFHLISCSMCALHLGPGLHVAAGPARARLRGRLLKEDPLVGEPVELHAHD